MSKMPTPKPVDPAELPRLARAVIKANRFPFLATVDGDRPRLRPVSPVRTDGFTVYVANLRNYRKTGEINANPRVELAYLSPDHDQVRISGRAEIVTVPPICPQAVAPYEFSRAGELIDAAARSTRLWLANEGLHAEDSAREGDRTALPAGLSVSATAKHALCGASLPSCSI